MKKLLISIFSIFFWLISFSSAEVIDLSFWDWGCFMDLTSENYFTFVNTESSTWIFMYFCKTNAWWGYLDDCWSFSYFISPNELYDPQTLFDGDYIWCIAFVPLSFYSSWSSSIPSDISVFYDYWHSSTTISCNWDNSIYINGMASVSNQTTFTPFFNISYVDEDNQNLIESYNKDILYLENWQFKKTYTWDNQWILTVQNQWWSTPDIIFTWETLPVVVTWNSDNVFSNFGDNALSVLYWNIPWFITGGVILFLIFFIIRLFIPKNRR